MHRSPHASQILRADEIAQHPGDIRLKTSVLRICGTQGDNATVDQLGEVVVGHPRELVAGDQRVVIPGVLCSGHAARFMTTIPSSDGHTNWASGYLVIW